MSAPTPLLDFFRRGQVARDVRLLAAQGALAPRAHEQLAILILLLDDTDPQVRAAAQETIERIPPAALTAFLARPDVSVGVREFFADRGIFPAEIPPIETETDDPLIDTSEPEPEQELADGGEGDNEEARASAAQKIANMSFTERLMAAIKGTREIRGILIRDPNKAVAASVLSSPKVNESEIEAYARMTTVSDEILRMIGTNRAWIRNYGIIQALTKNPKTPLAVSLNLMGRLNFRDMQLLSIDRNIPEPLRIAARRKVVDAASKA